ncbi:hypothetical protein [Bifidobacterium moukalabense]|uniref:hypothetical protein n=1 Tax=Bifidobacterium moukalabense TaxID=1333651 RepID=UPI0010F6BE99|nr:hypothetical protein [Bifidobacterium moukalabense]
MTIELVDGKAGTAHISSEDKAIVHQAKFGKGSMVFDWGDSLKCTMQDANKATIGTGCASIQGLDWHITSAETVTITNGSSGLKRHDIIAAHYHRDTTTGVETIGLIVFKGTATLDTPVDPAIPDNTILNGAADAYQALWRIPLDGITVGTPARLATPVTAVFDSVTRMDGWQVIRRSQGYDAYRTVSMTCKPHTNMTSDITLPIPAAVWDSYMVGLQLMNNVGGKVPNFNNIQLITNLHTARSFQLVAWNDSSDTLTYRVAIGVHVMDAAA